VATYYSQRDGNSSNSANWNTSGGGGGTSPASVAAMNTHTFVIQKMHIVTFDIEDAPSVDGSVSGWTTGITLRIEGASAGGTPGQLTLSEAANTQGRVYGLRFVEIKSPAVKPVPGRIRGGTAQSPMPAVAVHRWKAAKTLSTSTGVVKLAGLDVQLYAQPPLEAVYRLTAAAEIGATELHVKGDRAEGNPQTETEWRAGWRVWLVGDYDRTASKACGERTALAATPVGDGVIKLAAPLTRAYDIGAPVIVGQRNVEITYDSYYSTYTEWLIQGGGTVESVLSCAITNSRAFTTYGSCFNYALVGSGIRIGPAAVLAGMWSAGRNLGGTFDEGSVIVGTRHGIYNFASGIVDIGSCEIYGAYDFGVLGQNCDGFVFDGVIERSNYAVDFSGGAVELHGIIRGCGSGVVFSSSGIEARSITGSVAISDCKRGMSCGGGGFEIGGTISISDCVWGLNGRGFALRDSVTISNCDTGCHQVSDSSFGDDVVISNCPVGMFDGWGIEFSGNAKVTGATQGLREMSHVIIGGSAEIAATSAAVDCCMKVLLKDNAKLTCSHTTARLTGDMLIVGPDITCGTDNQRYTFDRCAVRVENATVFPVLAGE
jgi:hypothetical protein